ncbi:MAG TPA: CAP domain-containing protein [Acidobacteriaceae bacterium]|nr:CAP domain-containing protein [Acidobacteriaceae bacterium]
MALLVSCGVTWAASGPRLVNGPTVAEQYLLSAANAERAQRGLQPLHWDRSLYDAASYHAEQMAERESISHQYEGEPELMVRGQEAGARFSVISENVAEAPSALMIQEAWMNSAKHRENLLDPRVDSIGIRVIARGNRLYAVEDFDRSVTNLSLEQQEVAVGQLLQLKSSVAVLPTTRDARRTCSMESGYAGDQRPWFVMRYTADDLSKIPAMLEQRLATGHYNAAVVGACPAEGVHSFSAYSIAVLLYR